MPVKKNIIIALIFFFLIIFILTFKLSFLFHFTKDINPISTSITRSLLPTPKAKTVTIGLGGDLGLGRHITSISRSKKDFSWPFQLVSSVINSNDFNLVNLESPIINDCPPGLTGTFTFCGDTRFLPYLKDDKFIFNLANNHIFNYGQDGFTQTKQLLDQNQINYFYSHNSDTEFLKKEINGIAFGFLGFDFITNPNFDQSHIINLVKKYDSQVDWLIVSLHWGNEYQPQPEKWRVDLAHQLVSAGADIIHGHHPHVYQPSEIYHGKPIFYSLGNFVFDQNWSKETSQSNFIFLTLDKQNILQNNSKSYVIRYNSQPEFTN